MEFIKMIFAVIGLLSLIGGCTVLVLYVSKKICKKRQKKFVTFTKTWVSRLLWFGCIWITLSYILAFIDRGQIAESLSSTVANVIIFTILGYLCKSFFETKEEEKVKYLRDKNNLSSSDEEL